MTIRRLVAGAWMALCGVGGLCGASTPAAMWAEDPAPDRVVMTDGKLIVAPILKETSEAIWLDLGHDVLRVPRTQIESIERGEQETEDAGANEDLFQSATGLPERTPKELARRFGGAVIKVATPSGLGSGFIIHPDGYAITNAHVVQGETRIKCTVYEQGELDFRRTVFVDDVEIIAVNEHTDLALLKLTASGWRALPDRLRAGRSTNSPPVRKSLRSARRSDSSARSQRGVISRRRCATSRA